MLKKNNYRFILLIFILFIIITTILMYNVYKGEKEKYEIRNDYTRANIVMTLSYNKEFSMFYTTLRIAQSMTTDIKITREELIYDFAKSKMIPIFTYLKKGTEDTVMLEAFEKLGNLISDYNFINIGERENLLIRQDNDKYYKEDNDIYTYYTKKKVITKEGFIDLYNEYLRYNNYKDVKELFLKKFKKETNITIPDNLIEDDEFYNKYENCIVKIIAKDVIDFCNYVSLKYLYEADGETLVTEIKRNIDNEEILINYKLKKLERIYNKVSKYETYNYILDINDLFKQIEELGYPKIYF